MLNFGRVSQIYRWFYRSDASQEFLLSRDCIVGNARFAFKQVDVNVKYKFDMCDYNCIGIRSVYAHTHTLYTHNDCDLATAYSASHCPPCEAWLILMWYPFEVSAHSIKAFTKRFPGLSATSQHQRIHCHGHRCQETGFGERKMEELPVVPHKAVAEVSRINRKPIGEIGCCESPMAEQKH